MAKQIVRILDDISPSELKLRNMSRPIGGLHNAFINELGQVEKRKGYTKYNTTSIGADHKIVGMHRFYKQDTSSKEFIVAWNTDLYKLAETSPYGATSIKSGLNVDKDTYFADFLNHCYIVNGSNPMMKYNLTNVRTVGITAPDAPTFNSNIDGSLSAGTYYFKYTFVDEDGYESNGGIDSAAMTAAADPNDGIKINIAVSGDAKVTKRRIYRTTVNGAIYYYDGEVADNITLTYDSIKADNTLGSALHTNHDAPPADPHLITKRGNRLYLGHDDELVISHLSDCEYFPPAWFIKTGNRQIIKGLLEQLNALPIFTENSIERLLGTDEDNFEFRNAFSKKGCYAIRSLVICDNLLIYLSYDGIYYFDGVSSGIFNQRLNEYLKDNINRTYIGLSCATYFNDRYMLCYPKGASTIPNETIVIDMKSKAVSVYSYAFSCFSVWDRGELRLMAGSNTEGRVYELETGLNDDGNAIEAYDKLDSLDFGIPDKWKQVYNIYIKCKTTTGVSLRMYYTLDNLAETYVDKTLTANTTAWYKIDLVGGGQRCREITIRPRINDKYDFTIMGYGMVIELEAPEYS